MTLKCNRCNMTSRINKFGEFIHEDFARCHPKVTDIYCCKVVYGGPLTWSLLNPDSRLKYACSLEPVSKENVNFEEGIKIATKFIESYEPTTPANVLLELSQRTTLTSAERAKILEYGIDKLWTFDDTRKLSICS